MIHLAVANLCSGKGKMTSSVLFTTFDPLRDAPEVCSVCHCHPPVFHFEFATADEDATDYSIKGFCCEPCATRLLKTLECTESREWAEETAALAADDQDTTEVRKRLDSLRAVLVSELIGSA
jgi:hypothetical protein